MGDKPVENMRRDLNDREIWARFDGSRTPGRKGVRRDLDKIIDIQIITIKLKTP